MNENRKLIHIEEIIDIQPIPEADRIVMAKILGWNVVIGKDQFKVGDKVVYCEIDSRLNTTYPMFSSLDKDVDKYGFVHIKSKKIRGVISQGICFPLEDNKMKSWAVGTDLTRMVNRGKEGPSLAVIHNEEYNDLKSEWANDNNRKKDSKFVRWFKKIWYKLFPRKKKLQKSNIPSPYILGVSKTDEERVQNLNRLFIELRDKQTPLIATEKVDGSSSTYHVDNKGNIYAASRNMPLYFKDSKGKDKKAGSWENSIWQKIYAKYNIEKVLRDIQDRFDYYSPNVTIQGEIIGPSVQGNPYKLDELVLKVFNIKVDNEIVSYETMSEWCKYNNIETVHRLIPLTEGVDTYTIPKDFTIEQFIAVSDGMSEVNSNVQREGIVYRTEDYKTSFKVVSNKWLLKKGE